MSFAPFPDHVAVREIDLFALDNSDNDPNSCNRADATIYTKLDDQKFLDLLTVRFNEWLEERRDQYSEEDFVLELMNCDKVKFVGGLPAGYLWVSKPRKHKRKQEKKDEDENGKKKVRKTTPDKYLFGHPHAAAVPFDSVTKFVEHAFWLIIGRRNPWTCDNTGNWACECSVCDHAYDWINETTNPFPQPAKWIKPTNK